METDRLHTTLRLIVTVVLLFSHTKDSAMCSSLLSNTLRPIATRKQAGRLGLGPRSRDEGIEEAFTRVRSILGIDTGARILGVDNGMLDRAVDPLTLANCTDAHKVLESLLAEYISVPKPVVNPFVQPDQQISYALGLLSELRELVGKRLDVINDMGSIERGVVPPADYREGSDKGTKAETASALSASIVDIKGRLTYVKERLVTISLGLPETEDRRYYDWIDELISQLDTARDNLLNPWTSNDLAHLVTELDELSDDEAIDLPIRFDIINVADLIQTLVSEKLEPTVERLHSFSPSARRLAYKDIHDFLEQEYGVAQSRQQRRIEQEDELYLLNVDIRALLFNIFHVNVTEPTADKGAFARTEAEQEAREEEISLYAEIYEEQELDNMHTLRAYIRGLSIPLMMDFADIADELTPYMYHRAHMHYYLSEEFKKRRRFYMAEREREKIFESVLTPDEGGTQADFVELFNVKSLFCLDFLTTPIGIVELYLRYSTLVNELDRAYSFLRALFPELEIGGAMSTRQTAWHIIDHAVNQRGNPIGFALRRYIAEVAKGVYGFYGDAGPAEVRSLHEHTVTRLIGASA